MGRPVTTEDAAKTGGPCTARSSAARDRIDDEHRQLETLLGAINQTRQTGEIARLAEELDVLRDLLVRHFDGEEGAEGLHQIVEEGASHRMGALQQLFDEHRQLLAMVDELRAEVAATMAGPVRRVHEQLSALTDALDRHEKREEELFGEAFYTDLGPL